MGLVYFGKRYLNTSLQRWVSADPLEIHSGGADPNLYAYVSGSALRAIDPIGLDGLVYIENNKDRMRYSRLRKAGLPVGSNPITKSQQIVRPWNPSRGGRFGGRNRTRSRIRSTFSSDVTSTS